MRMRRAMLGAVLATGAASAAPAQAPTRIVIVPPCAPPPSFPSWRRHPGDAPPPTLRADPAAELPFDETVYLQLAPIGAVTLALPLGKPAGPGDHGGLVTFHAPTAGTYRIGLGGRAWIDVVQGGKAVESFAHAMGTACSGLAKMVDFRLAPGAYTIQLSAAADPTMRIAITRLP